MSHFGNLIDKEQQSTALLEVPGAATIKACSVILNSFLHYDAFAKRTDKKVKAITDDLFHNAAPMPPDIQRPVDTDDAMPEAQAIAKAQSMVQHLKHTHSKNNNG